MLDSDQLAKFGEGAPWLWVSSIRRGVIFIFIFLLVFTSLFFFEYQNPWRILTQYEVVDEDITDWARVTHSIANAHNSGKPSVLLLGGSTARELTSDNQALSMAISSECKEDYSIINASTTSQTLTEAWSIAEALPESSVSLIAVGFNYYRLHADYHSIHDSFNFRRLPFEVPKRLEQFIETKGIKSGTPMPDLRNIAWLKNNLKFFSKSVLSESGISNISMIANTDPYQGLNNRYVSPAKSHAIKKKIVNRYINERAALYQEFSDQALSVWIEFVETYSRKGIPVLFLVLPQSDEMEDVDAVIGEQFNQQIEILREKGARIADLRHGKRLLNSDFYDQQHLLASGRRKIEQDLIQIFVRSIPGCMLESGD